MLPLDKLVLATFVILLVCFLSINALLVSGLGMTSKHCVAYISQLPSS